MNAGLVVAVALKCVVEDTAQELNLASFPMPVKLPGVAAGSMGLSRRH
jgi:hypothetical protein